MRWAPRVRGAPFFLREGREEGLLISSICRLSRGQDFVLSSGVTVTGGTLPTVRHPWP